MENVTSEGETTFFMQCYGLNLSKMHGCSEYSMRNKRNGLKGLEAKQWKSCAGVEREGEEKLSFRFIMVKGFQLTDN